MITKQKMSKALVLAATLLNIGLICSYAASSAAPSASCCAVGKEASSGTECTRPMLNTCPMMGAVEVAQAAGAEKAATAADKGAANALAATSAGPQAGDAAGKDEKTYKQQKTCPILGGKINKIQFVDAGGYRFYVCCPGCNEKIKADPKKALDTLKSRGEMPEKTPVKNEKESKAKQ